MVYNILKAQGRVRQRQRKIRAPPAVLSTRVISTPYHIGETSVGYYLACVSYQMQKDITFGVSKIYLPVSILLYCRRVPAYSQIFIKRVKGSHIFR